MTDRANNITAKNLFTVIKYLPDGIAARTTLKFVQFRTVALIRPPKDFSPLKHFRQIKTDSDCKGKKIFTIFEDSKPL